MSERENLARPDSLFNSFKNSYELKMMINGSPVTISSKELAVLLE
jgi:hypothetical protein